MTFVIDYNYSPNTRVAGVIISPIYPLQFSHLQWQLDIPVVVVDRTIQDLEVDTVVLNNVASALLTLDHAPDAIMTSNSLTLEDVLAAIRDHHLHIPGDILLVGFDETSRTALVQPPITLIAQPTYDIGKTAAELLLQRIADPTRPVRQSTMHGKLVERGSSESRSSLRY